MANIKPPLVNQPSALPTRKIAMGALAAAATAVVQSYAAKLAQNVPNLDWLADPDVKSAIPVLVGFGVSYLVRDRAPAPSQPPE